jgi:hypothetical protein
MLSCTAQKPHSYCCAAAFAAASASMLLAMKLGAMYVKPSKALKQQVKWQQKQQQLSCTNATLKQATPVAAAN